MHIACGITTAPRSEEYLTKTLRSLAEAKILQVDIFAEPDTDLSALDQPGPWQRIHYSISQNESRRGNFRNWIESARKLIDRYQGAEFFLMAEDDVQFSKLCLLEASSAVHKIKTGKTDGDFKNFGFLSFYTPSHYQMEWRVIDNAGRVLFSAWTKDVADRHADSRAGSTVIEHVFPEGLYRPKVNSLYGALALLFTRESLELVLNHDTTKNWKDRYRHLPSKELACVDACIGEVMVKSRRDMWYLNPGLAQHIGEKSSLDPLREISHLRRSWSVLD